MSRTIFINRILEPIIFSNQLIEFLFDRNDKIEITLYGKIESEDKKALKGIYNTSFIRKKVFKNYNFNLDLNRYKNIKNRLEKYFVQDWGILINENYKGLFSFKMDTFNIDCVDENDSDEKKQFFDSLIKIGIIDKYEIIEDDYIDPYYQNKRKGNHSI